VPHGRARLVCKNPAGALSNLEEFSHVWLIFVFHEDTGFVKRAEATNPHRSRVKAKVAPPCAQTGSSTHTKVGLFSTRTPHRPNPIGLSTAVVRSVDPVKGILELSAVDLIDGTPILDVKPYLPWVDALPAALTPAWIPDPGQDQYLGRGLSAHLTPQAEKQLRDISPRELDFYTTVEEVAEVILEVASMDMRSSHKRRGNAEHDKHRFAIDNLKIELDITDHEAYVVDISLVRKSKQF